MAIKTFRDLVAWQRGMELTRATYRITQGMPRTELFGLTSQMRRAAASIPMNIAEGFGQHTRPELLHGLRLATGSLFELSTAYELATSLSMIQVEQPLLDLIAEEDRIISALIRSLEEKTARERRAKR
jgi:four helix bundle protein